MLKPSKLYLVKTHIRTKCCTDNNLFGVMLLMLCLLVGTVFSADSIHIATLDTTTIPKPPILSDSKNWSKWVEDRQGTPITTIVLHASFDPKHPDDLTFRRLSKVWDRYHASTHFVIEPSGKIIEMVPVTEMAKHAKYAKPNHNPFSIGIELLHVWNGEGIERVAYPVGQLESCAKLIRWLRSQHSITKVVSHRSVAVNGKKDPNMTPEEWSIATDGTPFPDPWPRDEQSWQPSPKDR